MKKTFFWVKPLWVIDQIKGNKVRDLTEDEKISYLWYNPRIENLIERVKEWQEKNIENKKERV
jgi:hypothetical protein